jgi:UPF0755 protein
MKKLVIVLTILVVFGILTLFWWENGLLPANSSNSTPKIFIVKQGEGVKIIANNLKAKGLIRDSIVFFLLARQQGLDKQIQAGDFRLNPSMTANQIANNLTHGTLDIWVTIPEGLRAEEIADILKDKIPSYKETWRQILDQNEGYLFPDTYLIPRDADINLVLSLLKNNFQQKYDSVKQTKTTNLSEADTITVASIIEREAVYAGDRPLVASVIMNRLNIGMVLGADPTVMYALGYQADTKTWWKKDLTVDDLAINSPYNTRKNPGVPPTPISNPGISAIEAALNPAESNYLYYFSDKQGHLHFATTLEGHNANIKKYE